jgi:hypothetical protein
MNLKQIERLEETLKAELQADLDAIRRVKRLLKEQGGKARSPRSQPILAALKSEKPPTGQPLTNGESAETKVRAVIQKQAGRFGLADLAKALPDVKRSTISGVLFREQGKTVNVIVKGQGRRVGVYEKM